MLSKLPVFSFLVFWSQPFSLSLSPRPPTLKFSLSDGLRKTKGEIPGYTWLHLDQTSEGQILMCSWADMIVDENQRERGRYSGEMFAWSG
jgi:hypothetical protein